MTQEKLSKKSQLFKEFLSEDSGFLKEIVKTSLQEILEAEMDETLGANKSERSASRLGYRSGYYTRNLATRVGKIELRVPQDRGGFFRTEIFERYQRSEKALVTSLMEMYLQGVSTRKVKKITEELCGTQFSAQTVSNLNKTLDAELEKFATRKLDVEYPYLILDATYIKVRDHGVVRSQATLIAIGVNWDGCREILAMELANRESTTSWRDFLIKLKERGLSGVNFVVSDNHEGIKKAVEETLPIAIWQRCYVHFLRNAFDYLPRKKTIDDVLTELRWIYARSTLKDAKEELCVWLNKWHEKYPKLCEWVEENIDSTLSYYILPKQHHKNMRSSNVLERLNEEIKRRTFVIRIFPNKESCLRLVRALGVEIQEFWIERSRYLNMDFYKENQRLKMSEFIINDNKVLVGA